MKISTRGRYAIRLLADLAENQGDGFVSLTEIATRQGISKKYLEQIISTLCKAGYLQAVRGLRGGYRLARAPEEYPIGEILRCTEGGIVPVSCADPRAKECPNCDECSTFPIWKNLAAVVSEYLDSITLQDVVAGDVEFRKQFDSWFEDGAGI